MTPFTHGSALYTDIMKTEALRQALDAGKFDAAFGGARRDEEASRAKERIYSSARPITNGPAQPTPGTLGTSIMAWCVKGESVRAFPLSNWRKSISGATSRQKTSRSSRSTMPRNALYRA